eukprot:Seg4357.5 transcript_id=Seg4357.5/GoldUCD/mRNA.D3Y31 product="hypothetical protein" protein_id=Seg4357.5/GoldUCD/D3Y31
MVIEPDVEAIEVCKKTLQSIKGFDIEFSWQVMPMQEYFSLPETTKYDMIHFIHSLCEVTRCATVLPEVLTRNYLAEDGILFAVLGDYENSWLKHHHILPAVKHEHGGHHTHCHGNSNHHDNHSNDKEGYSHGNQDGVAAAAQNDCQYVNESLGRKETEFVNSGDAMKLKKAIEGCGWKTDMFTMEMKQDVTAILSRSEKGMATLGLMLEIKDVDKKLKKEDLDNIIRDMEEKSQCENDEEEGKKFVTSSNNVIIVYR